jgi:TRAP-type C4-dicarboxylate transport system permease large subunit
MLLILLILGCFLDQLSIMMITIPIFFPLVSSYGMDPIWFAVLFLIQLELAGITPPFGLMLYVLRGTCPGIGLWEICRAIVPIIVIQMVLSVLILVFPPLTSWLPGLMVGGK